MEWVRVNRAAHRKFGDMVRGLVQGNRRLQVLMRHQDGAVRRLKYVACRATQDGFAEPGMAIGPHDQQICIRVLSMT